MYFMCIHYNNVSVWKSSKVGWNIAHFDYNDISF